MKIISLIPVRDRISKETSTALTANNESHELLLLTEERQPVDVARNILARRALAVANDPSIFPATQDPFVFWIDSDAFFLAGTLTTMIHQLKQNPWIDVLAPLSGPRIANHIAAGHTREGDLMSFPHPGVNCQPGDIVEAVFVSTHFFAHRASLLTKLGDEPFGSPTDLEWTDDGYFCMNARKHGARLAITTAIPVFHVEERTGAAFLPYCAAARVEGATVVDFPDYAETPKEQRNYGRRLDEVFARQAIAFESTQK
jgi:hypothetical protein